MHLSKRAGSTCLRSITLTVAIWFLAPTAATAQSFNIDLNDSFTGLPATFAGAAGQAGTWVNAGAGTTNGLTDVQGATSTVNLTVSGGGDTFNPQTTTESILLRDGFLMNVFGAASITISFSGLQDGNYRLYYYSLAGGVEGLSANTSPLSDLPGQGSADSIGSQGSNWNVAEISVSGGALNITGSTGSGGSGGLSGLQLTLLPSTSAGTGSAHPVPALPKGLLFAAALSLLVAGMFNANRLSGGNAA